MFIINFFQRFLLLYSILSAIVEWNQTRNEIWLNFFFLVILTMEHLNAFLNIFDDKYQIYVEHNKWRFNSIMIKSFGLYSFKMFLFFVHVGNVCLLHLMTEITFWRPHTFFSKSSPYMTVCCLHYWIFFVKLAQNI